MTHQVIELIHEFTSDSTSEAYQLKPVKKLVQLLLKLE